MSDCVGMSCQSLEAGPRGEVPDLDVLVEATARKNFRINRVEIKRHNPPGMSSQRLDAGP